jgi:hypothetical protein
MIIALYFEDHCKSVKYFVGIIQIYLMMPHCFKELILGGPAGGFVRLKAL